MGVVGLASAALMLVTGSLAASIAIHVAIDLLNGALGRLVLTEPRA